MQRLTLSTTKRKHILDITEDVNAILSKGNLSSGLCSLTIHHTTAALTTADLDPGTDLDMLDAFEEMIPKLQYRHPHNPDHVGDHIMSSIIDPTILLPFEDRQLILGTWQRVVLVELDGPRERNVTLSTIEAQ
jgi:secondary thiamine-phosphate synthase enzyme